MHRNLSDSSTSVATPGAATLIARLQLEPHPEGGWYREVHRSGTLLDTPRGPRAALTSIYYLLEKHQHSRWHVVTSDEIWHFAGGTSLELLSYEPRSRLFRRRMLGPPQDGKDGQEPTLVVNAGEWQAARSSGEWSLVGCDVGPGFDFEDFSLVSGLAGHEAAFTGDLAPYSQLL